MQVIFRIALIVFDPTIRDCQDNEKRKEIGRKERDQLARICLDTKWSKYSLLTTNISR